MAHQRLLSPDVAVPLPAAGAVLIPFVLDDHADEGSRAMRVPRGATSRGGGRKDQGLGSCWSATDEPVAGSDQLDQVEVGRGREEDGRRLGHLRRRRPADAAHADARPAHLMGMGGDEAQRRGWSDVEPPELQRGEAVGPRVRRQHLTGGLHARGESVVRRRREVDPPERTSYRPPSQGAAPEAPLLGLGGGEGRAHTKTLPSGWCGRKACGVVRERLRAPAPSDWRVGCGSAQSTEPTSDAPAPARVRGPRRPCRPWTS